ncbi:MAG TPA: MogA/MoaB family molybdenum cofactor biosynthesis protein [bacterium]|nr:MogA/MoaB family molybdenum cofactor biosynthesis protein [bacterium]
MSMASWPTAVLIVSDRAARGERPDASGPRLCAAIRAAGGEVVESKIIPDEKDAIEAELRRLADVERIPLILTTGGTGFAPRDVTPEATRNVLDKEAPGLSEHARAATIANSKFAPLSRGIAGIRRRSLIVNLPGSPQGALEMLEVLLPLFPHALGVLTGTVGDHPQPCS